MKIEAFYPIFLASDQVVIDSRKVEENSLFFAFTGENFNGAAYAAEAIKKGAKAVILEDENFADASQNIFFVNSTLDFLQQLAIYHRSQVKIPIIGLTGSNGKTTTKEIIHAVLQKKFDTQYTQGNLNNHIGVPLTILSIRNQHQLAVVEMGANHQREIAMLCQISQPDFGYITNFGKAHLEGFGGLEGVIKGKSELYDYLKESKKTILVNQSDPIQLEKTKDYLATITFGLPPSDYYFEVFSEENFVGIHYEGQKIQSNLTGVYNFHNLSAAVAFGLHFGVEFNAIKSAIEDYHPTNMRSQVIEKNGKTLVLDTYNANPSSMAEALKNFKNFEGSKTVIIGDMLELGEESDAEHAQILQLAQTLHFDQIFTVGPNFGKINNDFQSFDTSEKLKVYLQSHPLNTKNILLKASRGIALEKVLEDIS